MLSAFDGVGAAPWLAWDLIGEPRAIFAWEVDRAAIQVADYHIPGIRHRGDITEDTPEDIAAEVRHISTPRPNASFCSPRRRRARTFPEWVIATATPGTEGTSSTSRRNSWMSSAADWHHDALAFWWRTSR